MTITAIKQKPHTELLAEEIYMRWRLEENYALTALHAEWVIRWLGASLAVLIAREVKRQSQADVAVALKTKVDALAVENLGLLTRLDAAIADAREARKERNKARMAHDSLKANRREKREAEPSEQQRQIDVLVKSNDKLGRRIIDAQSVIDSQREEMQRMAGELQAVQKYRASAKKYAD